jgi:hypothetical protein
MAEGVGNVLFSLDVEASSFQTFSFFLSFFFPMKISLDRVTMFIDEMHRSGPFAYFGLIFFLSARDGRWRFYFGVRRCRILGLIFCLRRIKVVEQQPPL